jgi:hypothetical protein
MSPSKLFASLVALLCAPVAASAVTTLVPVNTTWRAIGPLGDLTGEHIENVGLTWEAANPGWNNSLNYDDSNAAGWKDAIETNHFPNPPYLRYWVDGTPSDGSTPSYYRKLFNIPGIPTGGSLNFGVDDDAYVYLNGTKVFNDENRVATEINGINVAALLHSGLNLLAVKAQDNEGDHSIWGQLSVEYQVPEPSVICLAFIGLLFTIGKAGREVRRRR